MLRLLTPDLRIDSATELLPDRLRRLGLDALLLDIDCTLKRYREESLPPPVAEWLQGIQAAGIGVCLVSNGRTPRISALAKPLGVPFVCQAFKPLPFKCRGAVKRLGFDRRRTAMVGDQLFADVMAGRLAGLFTILVRPIHPEEERWFTRMKRPLERLVLRRLAPGNDERN